jgi:hypothetical protein
MCHLQSSSAHALLHLRCCGLNLPLLQGYFISHPLLVQRQQPAAISQILAPAMRGEVLLKPTGGRCIYLMYTLAHCSVLLHIHALSVQVAKGHMHRIARRGKECTHRVCKLFMELQRAGTVPVNLFPLSSLQEHQ